MSQCIKCGEVDSIKTPYTICAKCSGTGKIEMVSADQWPGMNTQYHVMFYDGKTAYHSTITGHTALDVFRLSMRRNGALWGKLFNDKGVLIDEYVKQEPPEVSFVNESKLCECGRDQKMVKVGDQLFCRFCLAEKVKS